MRPPLIHFITGLSPEFGGKPFILPHALAILSARRAYPDHEVIVWCMYEPNGPFWDIAKPHVRVSPIIAPTEIFGRPIRHFAHAADVLRLRLLLEHGGIYFDTDTLILRPISDLPDDKVVMGREAKQDGTVLGLCNAFIAAPQGAPFLATWLERYRDFDAGDWSAHSVRLPLELAELLPDLIHALPPSAFFSPGWEPEPLRDLFERAVDTCDAYSIHLWESKSWAYLHDLTPTAIITRDTSYNLGARPVIAAFPELAELAPERLPLWQCRLAVARSALPEAALRRSPFWYVGFHDADGTEIARMDADHRELQRIVADDGADIVIDRAFRAAQTPARWTIWPVDRDRRWLDPIGGAIDAVQPVNEEEP